MSLSAAAAGLVVFFLWFPAVMSQNGWSVKYEPTEICAIEGSSVTLKSTYKYPGPFYNTKPFVREAFWFKKGDAKGADSQYKKLKTTCTPPICSLTLSQLKKSDSDVYKFRFITDLEHGRYTGEPGVTLEVTGRGETCLKVEYLHQSLCALKGSSVTISCSYSSIPTSSPKSWFVSGRLMPVDMTASRVRVDDTGQGSQLHISDLRESDSAKYVFQLRTETSRHENDFPGTTLTVTDLQVQVISILHSYLMECLSSCKLTGPYTWFNNGRKIEQQTSSMYSVQIKPTDRISCALESQNQHRSPEVYLPQIPSVSVPNEVMEGSAVTLTCSSDANPAANYSWYKKINSGDNNLQEGPKFVLSSVQVSDSGNYFCEAKNQLGSQTKSFNLEVQYAPKHVFVTVNPPGEIVEGSLISLRCNCSANPTPSYSWSKGQIAPQGQRDIFNLPSIRSGDTGNYMCKCENKHGSAESPSVFIDVLYPPRLLNVSLNVPGEVPQGSSVTLTCSSDANPAPNYTWYKDTGDSPKAFGRTFTIGNIQPEDGGHYSCVAQNRLATSKSSIQVNVRLDLTKFVAVVSVTGVLLILLIPIVVLFLRRRKGSTKTSKQREQGRSEPTGSLPGPTVRQPMNSKRDVQYASVRFKRREEELLYSNINVLKAEMRRDDRQKKREEVIYSEVRAAVDPTKAGNQHENHMETEGAVYSLVGLSKQTGI